MNTLPSYQTLKDRFPLSSSQRLFIHESRQTVRNILDGKDPRLLLIVGPCSIHDPRSAKEFALQLLPFARKIAPHFFILMRAYFEKPRTSCGWKGFLYDPLLDGSHAIQLGLEWTRQLLLELSSLQVPVATEFLDPLIASYYEDLITWGSIGARTSSSQIHRHFASHLNIPIGFKNGTSGNLSGAILGVLTASQPQTYIKMGEEGTLVMMKTPGNPDSHLVLRGGETAPNYDPSSLSEALTYLEKLKLPPRLLIDCSHHNSGKQPEQQIEVFQSVIHQIWEGNQRVRGLMLESHLLAGNQPLGKDSSGLSYGISITDPCLDWASTAQLIEWGTEALELTLI